MQYGLTMCLGLQGGQAAEIMQPACELIVCSTAILQINESLDVPKAASGYSITSCADLYAGFRIYHTFVDRSQHACRQA